MRTFLLLALCGGLLLAPRGLSAADDANSGNPDLAKQLADTQDKLSTALHSYTLLQDETTKLHEQADKDAADKAALQAQLDAAKQTIASLTASAAAASQLDGLRDQLRQARDQIASLAGQNYELKRKLALQSNPPAAH